MILNMSNKSLILSAAGGILVAILIQELTPYKITNWQWWILATLGNMIFCALRGFLYDSYVKILESKMNKGKIYDHIYFSQEAFRNMIASFKENSSPDYQMKSCYENCAFAYASDALKNSERTGRKLPNSVVIGLKHILDFKRLKEEGKPIPIDYFKKVIESAYEDIK